MIFFLFKTQYAYSSNPKDFILELVSDAINKLEDKNLDKEQKSEFISQIASENVDIEALSFYTLGELRKSASEGDKDEYQKIFKKYFLKSLTSKLFDYFQTNLK